MVFNLRAKLKGYIHGVFYTKLSELENDIPVVETREQNLTETQKRIARENIGATTQDAANQYAIDYTNGQIVLVRNYVDEKNIESKNYTDNEITEIKEYTDDENLLDRNRLSSLEFKVGSTPTFMNLTDSVVELFNLAESLDPKTLERINGILRVKGIRKADRVVTVNTIEDIEQAIIEINQEIDRTLARGGYLTPFDFGWDGLGYTINIGDTFTEYRNGIKTLITVVAEDEDYPQGVRISLEQAKLKSMEFQIQLFDWASEDIWNKGSSSYRDVDNVYSAVTLVAFDIEEVQSKTVFQSTNYKYVWKQENGLKVFGKMLVGGEEFIERIYIGNGMDFKTFVVDEPTRVIYTDLVGCDFIVWEHNIKEIYDGTKIINLYNGWMYQYTPMEWGIANIAEQNIKFATDLEGGIVKTQSTQGQDETRVYGVKLDVNNKMYVDGLGIDLDNLNNSKLDRNELELQDLYNTLELEGWL